MDIRLQRELLAMGAHNFDFVSKSPVDCICRLNCKFFKRHLRFKVLNETVNVETGRFRFGIFKSEQSANEVKFEDLQKVVKELSGK